LGAGSVFDERRAAVACDAAGVGGVAARGADCEGIGTEGDGGCGVACERGDELAGSEGEGGVAGACGVDRDRGAVVLGWQGVDHAGDKCGTVDDGGRTVVTVRRGQRHATAVDDEIGVGIGASDCAVDTDAIATALECEGGTSNMTSCKSPGI